MGIRIHKVLGYGLTDVKTRGYKIADGRINRQSLFLDGRKVENLWKEETLEKYLDWVKERSDVSKDVFSSDLWLRKDSGWYTERDGLMMSDAFVYDSEYGLKNVLLLKPLVMKDWSRYDDPIDWIEETYVREPSAENGANWFKILEDGIFPYIDSYMDARTGERVKDGFFLKRIVKSPIDEWKWDVVEKDYGFKSKDDIRENLVPLVPQEIRDLAEYSKLFTNEDVWKQLRPMIYVYWS